MYPELDSLTLTELEARFRALSPEDPENVDYYKDWFDEVAIAIRKRDADEGVRFLRGEVAGTDLERLKAILLAVSWINERDRGNGDLLVEGLAHSDEDVVARSIDGLRRLGGCGLTERVLALGADPRPWVRGAALRFAAQVVPDRAPALMLGALTDAHYIVRWNAVEELEELEYAPALARIEALRLDPHPRVREAALSAIVSLATPDQAAPLLFGALGDPHHFVRENAVRELEELEFTAALPSIKELCADPHPEVRQAALAAVDKLAAPDEAIALLVGALRDPAATVRFSALGHLDRLEQFTDRAVFERMLEDPDEDVRDAARSGLSHLPGSARPQ